MKTLFLGTTNVGKIRELSKALQPLGIHVETPLLHKLTLEIQETGDRFEDNALLKAKAWAYHTKLPTLVDDSGLCIDALGGKPGVHSRRFYAGSDNDRNSFILNQLKGLKTNQRAARYIAVLAFYKPEDEISHITTGVCEGRIAISLQGSHGFGYDPLFIPKGYSRSFGLLPDSVKATISHRAKALADMLVFLKEWSHS